ncbi:MAG: hypothetical protein SV760_10090 [Halobacteria archaeon]|nr:hypothetical protein [Halobacteria archaeon]
MDVLHKSIAFWVVVAVAGIGTVVSFPSQLVPYTIGFVTVGCATIALTINVIEGFFKEPQQR